MAFDTDKAKARYLKLRADHPDQTANWYANKLGISPSTFRKYRPDWDTVPPAEDPVVPPAAPPEPHPNPLPPIIEQLEFDPEWAYKKVKVWAGPKKPKASSRPPREKRFSETSPQAWNLAKNFLPRLQVLIPMLVVCYLALTETMAGNYEFYKDWASALHLPQIMAMMSSPETIVDSLLANNGMYIWVIVALVLGVVLFYEFVWKSAFKEYRKKVYMREYKEGRCYWHEGNWCHRTFDRIYRSPPRKTTRFWIRTHWWPMLNIFNPRSSMLEITISSEENYFVRGNKLIVEEKPIRRLTDHNKMVTCDEGYEGAPVPVAEAQLVLEARTSELITRTQKVALSNPHIRKRTLEKSGIAVTPEFVEEVRKAKKEREPLEETKEAAV